MVGNPLVMLEMSENLGDDFPAKEDLEALIFEGFFMGKINTMTTTNFVTNDLDAEHTILLSSRL